MKNIWNSTFIILTMMCFINKFEYFIYSFRASGSVLLFYDGQIYGWRENNIVPRTHLFGSGAVYVNIGRQFEILCDPVHFFHSCNCRSNCYLKEQRSQTIRSTIVEVQHGLRHRESSDGAFMHRVYLVNGSDRLYLLRRTDLFGNCPDRVSLSKDGDHFGLTVMDLT